MLYPSSSWVIDLSDSGGKSSQAPNNFSHSNFQSHLSLSYFVHIRLEALKHKYISVMAWSYFDMLAHTDNHWNPPVLVYDQTLHYLCLLSGTFRQESSVEFWMNKPNTRADAYLMEVS